ncbi:hypothetical protein CHS0354_003805 [Potamilus streckersoni]|uniref:LRAT domain-containing protein n=1 Tax=Potamilus streckersoni TaxID=2493646 RepID=A0AAE0T2Z1_9BIVA|nr:hypothetical protein CHS0354_003805 [Potamilus streckersoni]
MSDSEIVAHNANVLRQLRVGDTIEFPRSVFYSHWAVYIGDEQVVHLTGDDNDGINGNFDSGHLFTICGKKFKKAFVKVDDFWNVVLGSKVKVNRNKDRDMRPLRKEEIVERALSKLGEIGYNVMWCNCEHFANWCRYGKEKSEQVDNVLKVGAIGVSVLAGLAIVVGSALKRKRSQESDEEESEH